ncbi:MAG: hypothetical protein ACTSYC_10010 [Promethearchaeota archaeon]
MKIIPKIGFAVILHPFEENAENAQKIFENGKLSLISKKEVEIVLADELIKDLKSAIKVGKHFKHADVDVICLKLATWSSDDLLLEILSQCEVPYIFWTYSHVHAGSLCGGQQFNMIFKELGKECIFVHGEDEIAIQKIVEYVQCVALRNQLKKIKVGIIGGRTQGMLEVACDEFSVSEIMGPRIESIGFEEFHEITKKIPDDTAMKAWEEIKTQVGKISIRDAEGISSIKNYFVLKKIIKIRQWIGLTIQCYPHHMGEACLAFSLLANEGIPGACEGDINSLILMYILMNFSGEPVHNIDLLYFFKKENCLLGSHCGCGSFKLASSPQAIELAHVRLANKGTCVLFPSRPGKVTMANLVGRKGTYRMAVLEGIALETELIFPGNPIKVKLPISIQDFLNVVEEVGLGHHWVIAYGFHRSKLMRLASLLGIDFITF